jgi:hypothetical protein
MNQFSLTAHPLWSWLLDNSDDDPLSLHQHLHLLDDPHGDHVVEHGVPGASSEPLLSSSSGSVDGSVAASATAASASASGNVSGADAAHAVATCSAAVVHRNLVVLALAFASPLQLVAVFVAGGDVPVICFGVFVGAVLVAMTSRHVMRHVRARRALDFSLLMAAVIVGSLVTAALVGVAVHRWSLFANPHHVLPSQVRRPLFESVPIDDDAWLPVYNLSRVKFDVQRDHVGQFNAADGTVVCAAPLAVRKQLAKEIHSRDDLPTNWAVCRGTPVSVDDKPFECASFYLSVTGSEYDRAQVLRRRRPLADNNDTNANSNDDDGSSGSRVAAAPLTVARNGLELCMLNWVHLTSAYDLRHVQVKTAHLAMQAAKDALQKWSALSDDQDNPLVTFDDDEDLRHLTFVRLIGECCAFETAQSSSAAVALLLLGNGCMAAYVALLSPWLQRRAVFVALLGFAGWLCAFGAAMRRLSLPVAQ